MWVFALYFAALALCGFILPACGIYSGIKYASLILPITMGPLLALQIRSGLALDSHWRAEYEKGTSQYTALIAWYSIAFVGSIVLCYIVLTRMP